MFYALESKYVHLIERLSSYGLSIKDIDGRTVYSIVEELGDLKFLEPLESIDKEKVETWDFLEVFCV